MIFIRIIAQISIIFTMKSLMKIIPTLIPYEKCQFIERFLGRFFLTTHISPHLVQSLCTHLEMMFHREDRS